MAVFKAAEAFMGVILVDVFPSVDVVGFLQISLLLRSVYMREGQFNLDEDATNDLRVIVSAAFDSFL